MKELIRMECRRFARPALAYAIVHLLVLAMMYRGVDLLHKSWRLQLAALGIHLSGALLLAALQLLPYRNPGRWVWLLHRPLSRMRIFASLALASGLLVAGAIGLPALLALLAIDHLTAHTADSRHYLLVLALVLMGMTAWLAGAYVIINRSLGAAVAMALPLLLLGHQASGWIMLAPTMLCMAMLAAIAYCAFKPDRLAPPTGAALLLTAIPLQLGFYIILTWAGAFLFQNGQIALGVHPLHSKLPPKDGFIQASRASGREAMLHGLAGATDPRAPAWRQELAQLEVMRFTASAYQYPSRHQFSNLDELRIVDEKRRVEWTFSHDAMRFHGRHMDSGAHAGWIGLRGIGDITPFPAVPLLRAPSWIMLPQALYAWDGETGRVHHLARLDRPETIAREPQQIGELLHVMTNRRLITYARPVENSGATMLNERLSIEWPHPFSDLERIDIATLLDGSLVSATFGRTLQQGETGSTQTVLFVDAAGRARLVAQRRLTHDFPAIYEHLDWWASPVLHTLAGLPAKLIDKGLVLDKGMDKLENRFQIRRPTAAWSAALAASVLAAFVAWTWLGSSRVTAGRKLAWMAACLLMGPATLGTMILLQARLPAPRIAEAQTRLMGRDSSIADNSPLV